MTTVLFVLGLVLLIGGAELLVRGAGRIATIAGISPLVVGLTIVSFGTSAPELAVTTAATLGGNPDLALGNVVGSNVLNVLLILGLAATFSPLLVQRRLVRLEVPFLIIVSALVLVLALDRSISRIEGAFLLLTGLTYTGVLVVQARRATGGPRRAVASGAGSSGPGGPLPERAPVGRGPLAVAFDIGRVVIGLALLVLGSRWIVLGATELAGAFGVPDLVIGLTVVSIGTSLPELATTLVATLRGERDLAVGNVVGSNIFNLLIILGSAATVSPDGVPVALSALTFDLPVMLAVAIACLPIFFTGLRIDRLEGLIFLGFYVAYTAFLVLDAANHHALGRLEDALLFFGGPLTILVFGVSLLREGARRSDE